jgi:hypothetical protein
LQYLGNHFVNFNQTLPKCSLGDPLPKLCSVCLGSKEGDLKSLIGLGISTIKKFTSGMGWGMTPRVRVIRYLICLVSHPDHKYIWYILMIRVTRQLKCIIAQAPGSYPTPYMKWTFKWLRSPPLNQFLFFVVSEKCVILKICTFSIKKKPWFYKKKNNRLIWISNSL